MMMMMMMVGGTAATATAAAAAATAALAGANPPTLRVVGFQSGGDDAAKSLAAMMSGRTALQNGAPRGFAGGVVAASAPQTSQQSAMFAGRMPVHHAALQHQLGGHGFSATQQVSPKIN